MEPRGLTEREHGAVAPLISGRAMGNAAERLPGTEHTVGFHHKSTRDKLGAESERGLVQMFPGP